MKKLAVSAFLGLAALTMVNLTMQYSGVSLPVSPLSIGTSTVLGIPGVILLVILENVL